MVFGDVHREEAPNVGDPDDVSVGELAGIAPQSSHGGAKPAVDSVRGKDLCEDCHPDDPQ